jgi:hypothetical protein
MKPKESKVFDRYATDYHTALAHGLAVSGEERSYFAHGRVKWLRDCLVEFSALPQKVMDYGCGTGSPAFG